MAVSLKYARHFLVSMTLLALLLFAGGVTRAQEPAEEKVNSTTPPAGEERPDPIPHVEEPENGASSEQAYGNIEPTFVADSRSIANTTAESPVFSIYKDFDAWWNDDRDSATLRAMGKTLGTDWFTPKVADCKDGISTETDVAVFTSNSYGRSSTRDAQNSPECQASLEDHLKRGKVLIVDMGDNDYGGGFKAPGAQGIATDRYPSNSSDATLAPAAKGSDGILGTSDDHPIVKGPDGAPGTADDLTNSNIDACCYVAHGNLEDGITLPENATTLVTANFGGEQKAIVAEYDYMGGRVILDTTTKEFSGQQPRGSGAPYFMRNLFEYAEDIGALAGAGPDTPLIFVPGVGGSYLYVDGEERWPAFDKLLRPFDEDAHLFDLAMTPEGESAKDVKTGDITRQVAIKNIYGRAIEELEANGYVEGENLFVFPYDWRKDVRTVEGGNEEAGEKKRRLSEFIENVRNQTGSPQVDIMAHSQGGLVTLAALEDPANVDKVRKVLTLGTPVLGATKALGILQYQMPCHVDIVFGICISNSATVQKIFENMPGAYQLLPSPAFDAAEGAPLVIDRDVNGDGKIEGPQEGPQPYNQWSEFVARDHDQDRNMLSLTYESHAQIFDEFTPADPSVKLTRLVGSGVSTPDHIREYEQCWPNGISIVCSVERSVEYTDGDKLEPEGGDGTVPLHSADLIGSDQSGSASYELEYVDGVEHIALASDDEALDRALEYFGEVQQAQAQNVSFNLFTAQEGARPTPAPLGGMELEALGSLSGYVKDTAGNVLGESPDLPAGVIAQEIPLGFYNAISDTQSFFLNEDGSYTARLKVTGEEQTRLRIRSYSNNVMDGQAIFRVDAPKGAVLRLPLDTTQALTDLRLQIDADADGTFDKEVSPFSVITGDSANDTDPPTTRAIFKTIAKGKAEVTLNAKDGAEGSGVAATYYTLNGGIPKIYAEPFTAPFGTVVKFLSIDKAGNTETPKTIIVDDAPDTLDTAEALSEGAHIRRKIDPKGDQDWFSFKADGSSTYRIELLGLPADYDVELYDSDAKRSQLPTGEARPQRRSGRSCPPDAIT